MRDYRKEVEEDIIYNYMMHQQHKSQSIVSPVRIEQYYKENKDRFYQDDSVHLRLIQLSRDAPARPTASSRARPSRSSCACAPARSSRTWPRNTAPTRAAPRAATGAG